MLMKPPQPPSVDSERRLHAEWRVSGFDCKMHDDRPLWLVLWVLAQLTILFAPVVVATVLLIPLIGDHLGLGVLFFAGAAFWLGAGVHFFEQRWPRWRPLVELRATAEGLELAGKLIPWGEATIEIKGRSRLNIVSPVCSRRLVCLDRTVGTNDLRWLVTCLRHIRARRGEAIWRPATSSWQELLAKLQRSGV